MTKLETELLKSYIDLAIGDVKETIISSATSTRESIDGLNKTLKEHNGRLKKVEECQETHSKIFGAISFAKKRWYLALLLLVGLILLLIPVADALGLSGLVDLALNK